MVQLSLGWFYGVGKVKSSGSSISRGQSYSQFSSPLSKEMTQRFSPVKTSNRSIGTSACPCESDDAFSFQQWSISPSMSTLEAFSSASRAQRAVMTASTCVSLSLAVLLGQYFLAREKALFLIMFSVRLPFIVRDTSAHLHPNFFSRRNISRSYEAFQDDLETEGSRWLIQRSRHSRGVWKMEKPFRQKSQKETCFHFMFASASWRYLGWETMEVRRRRSSGVQGVLRLLFRLQMCLTSNRRVIWSLVVKIYVSGRTSLISYIKGVIPSFACQDGTFSRNRAGCRQKASARHTPTHPSLPPPFPPPPQLGGCRDGFPTFQRFP